MKAKPCPPGTCAGDPCSEPLPPPPGRPPAFTEDEHELARLTRALGHPARVRILRLLLERRTCVCGDLAAWIPLAQSTVSQHLAQLKAAGLIQGEIAGPRVCYCVHPGRVATLLARLQALAGDDGTPTL